jgi:hypothetical protein
MTVVEVLQGTLLLQGNLTNIMLFASDSYMHALLW